MIRRASLLGDKEATFSDDSLHRYTLTRVLRPTATPRRLLSIGLNPSTATHELDDNTIRKETKFARAWGFDVYEKGNLFGFRSTDPRGLLEADDPYGDPDNIEEILRLACGASLVLAAWGGPYQPKPLARMVAARAREVTRRLVEAGIALHCLAVTKDGFPRHPLYLPDASTPQVWSSP